MNDIISNLYESWFSKGYPQDWKISRIKDLISLIRKEKNKSEETPVISLTINGVKLKKNLSEGMNPETYIGHQLVYPGDLVICLRDLDGPLLVGISEHYGCTSNLYVILQIANQNIEYYNHVFKTMDFLRVIDDFSYGMRHSYNISQFGQLRLPVPQRYIQDRIVKELNTLEVKINQLINNQQQQIEKLKEYKQSLISEVVTKGLDSNVKLKDSGIDWIGKIPVHWNIVPLKYSSNITMGQSPKSESYNTEQVGKPFLGGNSDITDGFSSPKYYTTEITKTCKKGDILMSVRAPVGTIAKSSHDAVLGRGLCSIKSKISNDFTYFYMCFLENKWNEYITGTTFDSVNADDIKNMPYVLAPTDEILHLLEYMNNKTKLIDRLIKIMVDKVVCLNDYKKSLIYEYVTGKKEVS